LWGEGEGGEDREGRGIEGKCLKARKERRRDREYEMKDELLESRDERV
jgi:hypothetical protein